MTRAPRTCCAPLTSTDDLDHTPLCGAPATQQREVDGLVWDLCDAHAHELDAELSADPTKEN